MSRVPLFSSAIALILTLVASAHAKEPRELYQATAITTGHDERYRPLGFRDCLDKVLVRVSGDQRLLSRPEMTDLRGRAGTFVASFRYRDRLEGKPVNDEQGTYDRPHDLTCSYEPKTIDAVLQLLGSRPWLGERPTLAVLLRVEQAGKQFTLTADSENGQSMREAFAAAAVLLAMDVVFPTVGQLDAAALRARTGAGVLADEDFASPNSHRRLLRGNLTWSDADLGWNAQWELAEGPSGHRWQVRGVNFDEAFRVAVRGSAQILSGNGTPQP